MQYGGHWIRTTRRWAIYLRDGLQCTYCLREILELHAGGEFLTLDHVTPLTRGGDHSEWNVVTSCYHCNEIKQDRTLRAMADSMGVKATTLRSRIRDRRARPLDHYMEAARVLLGEVDGVPMATIVNEGGRLANMQFRGGKDVALYMEEADYWNGSRSGDEHARQADLFCRECGRPHDTEEVPF